MPGAFNSRRTTSVLAWLFLALLLAAVRVRAISAALHLRMMLRGHLLRMMLRAHLLVMRHLLIHRMRSVNGVAVFGHFAGVRFRLVTLKVLPVAMKIFGLVFVPVFSKIFCALAVIFGHVPGLALSFSRYPCSSELLSTFAVLVALIE